MPLTEERKTLRHNLMASNVEVLKYNLARKNNNIANFEISRVYYKHEGNKYEDLHLAIVMANEYSNTLWQGKSEKVDFFLLKGIVNQVFEKLGFVSQVSGDVITVTVPRAAFLGIDFLICCTISSRVIPIS
jgi:phenylalanyl-tRNA synthetase beta chain